MFVKSIRRLFISKYISFNQYKDALLQVKDSCVIDIENILTLPAKKKAKVVLVSIERGGNIPTTILNYSLTDTFKEEIRKGRVNFYTLHTTLSTRDKKPGSNHRALTRLRVELNNILRSSSGVTEENVRIYIVDDLLDSGKTLEMIHNALHKESWYRSLQYLFVFSKEEPSIILSKVFVEHSKQVNEELSRIFITEGRTLNTKKWLNFWYEKF